jgi:hypothetical protein
VKKSDVSQHLSPEILPESRKGLSAASVECKFSTSEKVYDVDSIIERMFGICKKSTPPLNASATQINPNCLIHNSEISCCDQHQHDCSNVELHNEIETLKRQNKAILNSLSSLVKKVSVISNVYGLTLNYLNNVAKVLADNEAIYAREVPEGFEMPRFPLETREKLRAFNEQLQN